MRQPAAIREFHDSGPPSARAAQEQLRENAKRRGNLDRRKLLSLISVARQQLKLRVAEIAVPEVPLDTETIRDCYTGAPVPQ
jgi:hypothetical protein